MQNSLDISARIESIIFVWIVLLSLFLKGNQVETGLGPFLIIESQKSLSGESENSGHG